MQGYFWNTVLAVNSVLWFLSLGFLVYGTGMFVIAFEWKQFLLAAAIFAALCLTELALAALAHD